MVKYIILCPDCKTEILSIKLNSNKIINNFCTKCNKEIDVNRIIPIHTNYYPNCEIIDENGKITISTNIRKQQNRIWYDIKITDEYCNEYDMQFIFSHFQFRVYFEMLFAIVNTKIHKKSLYQISEEERIKNSLK